MILNIFSNCCSFGSKVTSLSLLGPAFIFPLLWSKMSPSLPFSSLPSWILQTVLGKRYHPLREPLYYMIICGTRSMINHKCTINELSFSCSAKFYWLRTYDKLLSVPTKNWIASDKVCANYVCLFKVFRITDNVVTVLKPFRSSYYLLDFQC